MRHLTLVAVAILATAIGAAGLKLSAVGSPLSADSSRVSADSSRLSATMTELSLRDRDIALFARRVQEDTMSADDRARLAALYLQRGRESGDLADYRQAEAAARSSIALRLSRNTKAQLVLASSLLAQHRFTDALAAAEQLVAMDAEPVAYRALLAEIQLELGRYDEAERSFDTLRQQWRDLSVAPRLARWTELRGDPRRARVILDSAVTESQRRPELPREQVAWFHLRVADLALREGRLDDAERATNRGLAIEPRDARLFALHARLAMARGKWRDAIEWGQRAGDAADVATFAQVGDAHAMLRDSVGANAWWSRAEQAGVERQEPFNRQWTQFRVERDRKLPETLAILEREAAERPDVLGLQLLAWARHRTGDVAGARGAIAGALRLGTADATLHYQAGVIALSAGDSAGATRHLERALAINPTFHHRWASHARALLGEVRS